MRKSLFITFEGPDGSGKSTHSRLLADYLKRKGYRVIHTREPGGVSIAESLREILLHPKVKISPFAELLLYLAARVQHVEELIRPALKWKTENGRRIVVLCERFSDATYAYQGYGRGLGLKLVKELNHLVTRGLKPDLTFLLDLNPEEGLRKSKGDRLENESLSFHQRVRQGYLKLAEKEPKRIKVVKVKDSIKETQKEIRKIFNEFLTNTRAGKSY